MMKYDDDLMNEFVTESKEHLSTVEEDFLAMEKGSPDQRQGLIDKVFRAVHSIKGAAGFLGLNKINDLSHVMETILQMMRAGQTKPAPKVVDALLSGVDMLAAMLDNVSDSDSFDIQKVHDRLSSLLAKNVSSKAKKELNSTVKLFDSADVDVAFPLTAFAINNRPKAHEFLYILKYDLTEMRRQGGFPRLPS